jgi:mono/diheme cytochrome c family protein
MVPNTIATKRRILFVTVAIAVFGAAVGWIASSPHPVFPLHHASNLEAGDPARGKLVFEAGDCGSCHASPAQDDRLRLGGGMVLDSPYGPFHVPNISPDPNDGIGRWTTADLANALLAGVSPDGEHLYPTFPYTSFAHMALEDVRDLMAYLQSLPPMPGRPPPHELPFPLTIRRGIGLWKLLFFDRSPIPHDPSRDAAWNRGHYLVDALGHCAECHSTRNVFGAIRTSTRFAGGPDPGSVGYIPNITPSAIGNWSRQQISETLRTGITPDLRVLGSSMADVVYNTAFLPESDRDDIAAYIKALPPRATPDPASSQ